LNYDKANRVTSIKHDLATDIIHNYTYDNASRVTSFDTTGPGGTTRGYTYDTAGQLKTKTGGTAESYDYDDNGNRVAVGTQSIVTGLGNRLTNDGTYTYLYDDEGNQIRRTPLLSVSATNPVVKYGYDHRNRLVSVTSFASTTNADAGTNAIQVINYTYDAQDRRVVRAVDPNGGTPTFTNEFSIYSSAGNSSDQLSMRFGNAGELTHRYLHGPADQVLADETFKTVGTQRITDEVLWQLADQQGTIRDTITSAGTLRKHIDYDSFGKVTGEQFYSKSGAAIAGTHAEAIDQLFYYTGQERDATTGLQQHGARWYNPSTGRFLNEDPIGFDAGDPNLYRYVGNSPLNAVDPTGLVQAGNPLTNLFNNFYSGGYSGGTVSAHKPINQFVGSTNIFAGSTYNPYAAPLANLGSPIISQPRPSSSPGLSLGTLGYVLGNSVYNAAASVVAPASRAALSAGISLATSIPSFGQVGTSAADRYITKFGGQSIPAQQHGDLPIRVQQAINQPDRYGVTSHQGQGYYITDPSGAAHFVNNDEVLPTLTLMNRARSEAYEAAGQQSALRFYGNVLTSISPIHDAARDLGIAGIGYDYFEKNDRFTAQERFEAVLFSAAPSGNAGQARYADDLLDTLDEFRRYGVRDVGSDLGQQQGRQFRTDQLELLEFDPNTPSHIRGWLADQRRRIEQGKRVEPLTPPGYELSHGRTTPAREGYDYSNSRLQEIGLNQLEESVRRSQGRP
jgi:RHS repeat-associated protein